MPLTPDTKKVIALVENQLASDHGTSPPRSWISRFSGSLTVHSVVPPALEDQSELRTYLLNRSKRNLFGAWCVSLSQRCVFRDVPRLGVYPLLFQITLEANMKILRRKLDCLDDLEARVLDKLDANAVNVTLARKPQKTFQHLFCRFRYWSDWSDVVLRISLVCLFYLVLGR